MDMPPAGTTLGGTGSLLPVPSDSAKTLAGKLPVPPAEGHVVGYYNAGDRMKYWGKLGAFWGGFWGLLMGSAFFFIPGIGPILVAGPLAMAVVGCLEGAATWGGLSVLGAALCSIGIPRDSVVKYETDLKSGKLLLVVHGTASEVQRAKSCLDKTTGTNSVMHAEPAKVIA